jgi:hypothetical protein
MNHGINSQQRHFALVSNDCVRAGPVAHFVPQAHFIAQTELIPVHRPGERKPHAAAGRIDENSMNSKI